MRRPEPRWIVRETEPGTSPDDVAALARRLGVPQLVARLLWLRGQREEAPARAFLQPRLADLQPRLLQRKMDRRNRTGRRVRGRNGKIADDRHMLRANGRRRRRR